MTEHTSRTVFCHLKSQTGKHLPWVRKKGLFRLLGGDRPQDIGDCQLLTLPCPDGVGGTEEELQESFCADPVAAQYADALFGFDSVLSFQQTCLPDAEPADDICLLHAMVLTAPWRGQGLGAKALLEIERALCLEAPTVILIKPFPIPAVGLSPAGIEQAKRHLSRFYQTQGYTPLAHARGYLAKVADPADL